MSTMDEIRKMGDAYRTAMREKGKQAVSEELAGLFAAHPELKAIRWKQYTPYFNDGDECVFGLREVYYRVEGTPKDAGDYEDGYLSPSWDAKKRTPLETAVHDFEIGRDRDIYRVCFDDHVEVTATRDGVTVEEYEHD